MLCSKPALQSRVEVRETPMQSPEGKIDGEVLHRFVKLDISKLLLQTLLSVSTPVGLPHLSDAAEELM